MDKIEFEILADGTVSVKTTDISQANHMSADEVMDALEDDLGKIIKKEKVPHTFWKQRIVQKGGKIITTG